MADGHTLRFDTGRPCLDLIATVGARRSASPIERLDSADRLREWLVGTRLLPADSAITVEESWLPLFHELRTVVHRLVHAVTWDEPIPERDVSALNRYLEQPHPKLRLMIDSATTVRLLVDSATTSSGFLARLASDTAYLVSGEQRDRLRECAASNCAVIYLDLEHGRERLWCSKEICGNRERTARHRQRLRNGHHAR
jgi:predicted RNA-binding Zn ribbon-like protein